MRFSINPNECSIYPVDQFVYLKVGELKPYTKPGEPQLPMKTFGCASYEGRLVGVYRSR